MKLPSISRIINYKSLSVSNDTYVIIWIKDRIKQVSVNEHVIDDIEQTLLFIDSKWKWSIQPLPNSHSCGYILTIPKELLRDIYLKNRTLKDFCLVEIDSVSMIKPAPGIASRMQSILEMIEELLTTELSHREDAILSLLNTFLVYCEGQCNIQIDIDQFNPKTQLVHQFKQLVKDHYKNDHEVRNYAKLLNVSSVYLNECTQSVLGNNAKYVIIEAIIMSCRQALKFSNLSIKEIGYDHGFSSSDYFSTFFKNNTGISPSQYRKS